MRACLYCSAPFDGGDRRQKFCARPCAVKSATEAQTARRVAVARAAAAAQPVRHRKCGGCGSIFVVAPKRPTAKYCGVPCRHRASRARVRADRERVEERVRRAAFAEVAREAERRGLTDLAEWARARHPTMTAEQRRAARRAA